MNPQNTVKNNKLALTLSMVALAASIDRRAENFDRALGEGRR